MPIITNNFSGGDNHLITVKVAKKIKDCNFLCIGENTDKYIFSSLENNLDKKTIRVKQGRKVIH